MGKASRWLRGLLGLKKSESSSSPSVKQPAPPPPPKEKRRWSFVKSHRDRDGQSQLTKELDPSGFDQERRAIAVAAATAAVAEAAVAAAQAAAAVVRLTSSGRCSTMYGSGAGDREEWAALKIQSAFRGYLARRALRALKGLVKIQALVRGHIERKKTTRKVQQMQAVLRLQARARAERGQISESSQSSGMSSHFHQSGPVTPEKPDRCAWAKSMKHDQSLILRRNGSKSSGRSSSYRDRVHLGRNGAECRIDERLWEQQEGFSMKNHPPEEQYGDKILEVDMPKPLHSTKQKNLLLSTAHLPMELNSCPSSGEVRSLNPLRFTHEIEESPLCTAHNSPQFYSASSKGGSRRSSFTPTKSDGSRSFLSGYSDHPNYMAYTESSKAKVRSLSAPKQRPHFEKSVSTKRYSLHGFGDPRPGSQVSSSLQVNFASKAYPGSGRLDRLGMPIVRGGGGSAYRYYN